MPIPTEKQAFLLRTAELLHRYGTPSHRLERVMAKVSRTIGEYGTFLYTPTALIVSLGDGKDETTYLRRIDSGPIDITKLMAFDAILENLEDNKIDLATAALRIEQAAAAAAPFQPWVCCLAYALVCGCVAIVFGGRPIEALLAASLGCLFFAIGNVTARMSWERGLMEPLVSALGATLALLFARFVLPIDDRLTTLASLIVLLPGLSLTIAITELSVGHVSSGVARLAGAVSTLFILVMGVGISWKLGGFLRTLPDTTPLAIPTSIGLIALILSPACFAILFQARFRQWPIIYLAAVAGFSVHWFVNKSYSSEVAAFAGAFAVGCVSNLYARIQDRPALIASTPGMIMLVPGSLGYEALTALLESKTLTGLDTGFEMLLNAFALAGGLLVAGAVVPPKRIL